MNHPEETRDVYYIPPNFLTSGRLFGGMIRVRNAIESCVLVLITGIPIIKLPLSLTARIIILCLIPLPLGVFGVVGLEGDSLSEFVLNWIKWLFNRRVLFRSDVDSDSIPIASPVTRTTHTPPAQLGITIRQQQPNSRFTRRAHPVSVKRRGRKDSTTEDLIPVAEIQNGIIHTTDDRYIKILEVEPINFIDEIWQLVGAGSNAMAAEFCLEIFKIVRGYGGAAIAATQDLNDFLALDGGKYGKGIINNAKTKIILNLEDDEAMRVQDTLKLTDAEISNITRFERGNGLISTNSNHITVEFKASKLEKQLITTDRYELSQMVSDAS